MKYGTPQQPAVSALPAARAFTWRPSVRDHSVEEYDGIHKAAGGTKATWVMWDDRAFPDWSPLLCPFSISQQLEEWTISGFVLIRYLCPHLLPLNSLEFYRHLSCPPHVSSVCSKPTFVFPPLHISCLTLLSCPICTFPALTHPWDRCALPFKLYIHGAAYCIFQSSHSNS